MDASGRVVLGAPAPGAVPTEPQGPPRFHRTLPGYAPTPLLDLPALAGRLGLDRVVVKDEASRLGLPAFKILGASWAVARLIGGDDRPQRPAELTRLAARDGVHRLVAATDGNHGRAVARVAAWLDLAATVFVPAAMRPARREAIVAEGAELVVVEGDYDDAVRLAAAEATDPAARVINDADPDGGSPVPAWIIDGYATIFAEIAAQLGERRLRPDVVLLQIGVGAFAAAGVRWTAAAGIPAVGVEPAAAPCVAASLRAGRPVSVATPGTRMAGLDCGTPSASAWPALCAGLEGVVLVDDDEADDAARALAAAGVVAGESGAAGVAGLVALLRDARCRELRERLPTTGPLRSALVINTEGATDPERYAEVVTRSLR